MHFFRERGIRKQFIFFWTTKTYPGVTVNGMPWAKAAGISGVPEATEATKERFSYNGISTFWLWDGERVFKAQPMEGRFHNVILKNGKDPGDWRFSLDSPDIRMEVDGNRWHVSVSRRNGCASDFPADFRFTVNRVSPVRVPMGYKRTLITKHHGFDAMKIYHARWKGSMDPGESSGDIAGKTAADENPNGKGSDGARELSGSLYMQHITLNTTAIPWLWGVFHRDDGSYLTYFTSFLGPYMFRRSAEPRPFFDNRFKFLNRNLNFTPADPGETLRCRHVRYRVKRSTQGLPCFRVSGELPGGRQLRLEVEALKKCTYVFKRKKIWKNRFFYNEFPAKMVSLEYQDGNGRWIKDDPDLWTGNVEYSWGMLLN